jgi:hypothetical protein
MCWQLGVRIPVEKEGEDVNQDDSRSAKRLAWIWDPHPIRTHQEVADIMDRLAAGELLDRAESRGYKGRSPLLDIDGFDIVHVSNLSIYILNGCAGECSKYNLPNMSVKPNQSGGGAVAGCQKLFLFSGRSARVNASYQGDNG